MGNCCKKRLLFTDKLSSTFPKRTESDNSKKTSENINNNEKNKKEISNLKENNILILNKNLQSGSKDILLHVNKNSKENKKNEEDIHIDQKQFKNYKDILTNYLDFRKKIDNKCEEKKIYVVPKDDNNELISLYNEIVRSKDYDINRDKIIEEKLKNFMRNGEEIKTKYEVLNFEKCKERIGDEKNNKIDLLNYELCKKLKLGKMKNNDVIYINNENFEFRYLRFKNNKYIKINIINSIFSLKEIIEDNNLNDKLDNSYNETGKNIYIIKKNNVKKEAKNNLINNRDENKDIISLEINSQKKDDNNSKNSNIYEPMIKEEKENDKRTDVKGESSEFIMVNEENKKNVEIKENKENEENKDLIILEDKEKEKEKYLILIPFEILLLYNIQNKKIKYEEIYYLSSKIVIEQIIKEINNNKEVKDINLLVNKFLDHQNNIDDSQIIIQQFKQDNINLFEGEYNFNNINKENYFLEEKEIPNINQHEIRVFNDFIILNYEIYELLLKLFKLEANDDINKIFKKIELLNSDDKFIVVKKYDENIIYFCKLKENENIKVFEPIFLLFYNSKEVYLNEKDELKKNDFDIYFYLQEKKININNYSQKIVDEENIEIGYFINVRQDILKKENNEENEENKKPNKPIGLIGINSNSYLNSLLQCLYHIPELTNFFILDKNFLNLTEEFFLKGENIILNDIEINKDSLSFKYLEILYHLFHKKQNDKYIGYYSSKNILEYIQNKEPKEFEKNKGNSPKILCDYFIKKLKEETNEKENIINLQNNNLFDSLLQNEETLYEKYLTDFKFKNKSIIDQFITGIKLKNIYCEDCKESEQIFNDFYYLNFSLEKVGKHMENKFKNIDLNECFKYYFCNQKYEKICNKCGKNNNNFVSYKICLSPKILIIFLENTKEKGSLFKIDMEININEYSKEKNEGYKLIGMISFFQKDGSKGSYQAYCYSDEFNKWYYLFDEYVDEVDDFYKYIEKTKSVPYILFYRKICNNKD